MSAAVASRLRRAALPTGPTGFRALALAGAAVLTGAYLATLYHVVDVVGGPGGLELFVGIAAGALGLAIALGRTLRLRYALVLGGVLLVAGFGAYLLAIPEGTLDLDRQLQDTISLVSGLSVLRMTKAAVWALGFTPAPVFVSTYLFLRRRYALGVVVGGAALAFFISTGDIGVVQGLVGSLGAVAVLGFGRLDRVGGTAYERDAVVVLLVAILVVTTSISLVPGGQARPLLPHDFGNTVEANLVGGGDTIDIAGSIELSPTVRFTVEANRVAKWRVGAYDRYTGTGWVRSGQSREYAGDLNRPVSPQVDRIRQTYRVQSEMNVMPAAWKPTRVTDGAPRTRVTAMGGLEPREPLEAGNRYSVVSIQSVPDREALRNAGTDYPDGLPERYLQLPESTPDRVGTFTDQITAETTNPYDTARVIERWLETNKQYSLDVSRPSGDIAAGFLFEMDRGYCTYYATTMVAMLRSQGIPARFVVGYNAGERIGDGEWVVRGLNSHAWVEVYFPGHGWISFDPTPAGPRRAVEQNQLNQARAAGVGNVDPGAVDGGDITPPEGGFTVAPTPTEVGEGQTNGTITAPPGLEDGGGGVNDGDIGSQLPDERTVLYGMILLLGAATAVKRTGLLKRGRRRLWVRRPPEGLPAHRIVKTFDRLDYLLSRRYRDRQPDETPRAYLAALRERTGPISESDAAEAPDYEGWEEQYDDRLDVIFDLHEQAHYAGRATHAEADRAWALFTELREEWSAWD